MAKDFVTTPQDPIAKPPSAPGFSTNQQTMDGEPGYPKRSQGTPIKEVTFDRAFKGTPQDETRDSKA